MTVTVDTSKLNKSMKRLLEHLHAPQVFYREAGIHIRDYIRQTIHQQGRGIGWKPLAEMTRLKTGRRKALITLVNRVKYRANRTGAEIYFDPVSSQWTLSDHHRGYTSGPVHGKLMVVKKGVAFYSRKKSVVPARRLWPSDTTIQEEIRPIAHKWVERGVRKF